MVRRIAILGSTGSIGGKVKVKSEKFKVRRQNAKQMVSEGD